MAAAVAARHGPLATFFVATGPAPGFLPWDERGLGARLSRAAGAARAFSQAPSSPGPFWLPRLDRLHTRDDLEVNNAGASGTALVFQHRLLSRRGESVAHVCPVLTLQVSLRISPQALQRRARSCPNAPGMRSFDLVLMCSKMRACTPCSAAPMCSTRVACCASAPHAGPPRHLHPATRCVGGGLHPMDAGPGADEAVAVWISCAVRF